MLSEEKIIENYNTYVNLLKKTGDRFENIEAMLDHLGNRLAMAPASSRLSYHCAWPGGLIDHSLRVLKNAYRLREAYRFEIDDSSLIISCLFHDLGKVGDLDNDLYVDQESDWHREKLGQMYTLNEDVQKMPNAELGLYLLQHFNVRLELDEWIAIRINDGPGVEANKYYTMSEPKLALLVQQADRMACLEEKEADNS